MFQQPYDRYTAQDQLVWKVLFDRQTAVLHKRAASAFVEGLARIGFNRHAIPVFSEVSQRLRAATGWELTAVPGRVEDATFFAMLAERKFPATMWLRSMDQFDFVKEPDLFHDVFGHVPLLMDTTFANFLHLLGKTALQHLNDADALRRLRALYGYTVQFGLVMEDGKPRIYGAGLLSSSLETHHCVHEDTPRQPFGLTAVLDTNYTEERLQEQYFVLNSWEQLTDIVTDLAILLVTATVGAWELKAAC
ncbi:phenylalanine 4-monooxygenase [Hymenobacter crusticola]|uniref:Phenylalanine 4-monooxygenase n=1 Tax=Hymenobacter crusticola TaxID=1770526 RepID=A0A243WAP9_9BACT|nr:phenylalanine 4-monooxygenase [Hymenobacter crusticola]OUJ72635.1 phenylalanine 4-monooxygenase [Hymenobacter crusticola]